MTRLDEVGSWCNRCYGMADHSTRGHPRDAYTLHDFIDGAFVVDCSRCANEGIVYERDQGDAANALHALGWTIEGPRVFCPQCNESVSL